MPIVLCLCVAFEIILRSSHNLWCKSVHQLFPVGPGGNRKEDRARADGPGSHFIRLVNGNGLALLHLGSHNWSSPAAFCQDHPINPVPGDCGPYIRLV
ncbi:hypothetical protein P4O66_010937 [Electrophorus voltai]|uniref:Uncharacterized protein n=1 Tax=Electrophorus voltai TaxID=2609070 RepID=A0AAD8Z9T3_9TELE|nr:hypothetical protein P4O66_010937 [Electrophorus voltai]